jgi:hypothetical protein
MLGHDEAKLISKTRPEKHTKHCVLEKDGGKDGSPAAAAGAPAAESNPPAADGPGNDPSEPGPLPSRRGSCSLPVGHTG